VLSVYTSSLHFKKSTPHFEYTSLFCFSEQTWIVSFFLNCRRRIVTATHKVCLQIKPEYILSLEDVQWLGRFIDFLPQLRTSFVLAPFLVGFMVKHVAQREVILRAFSLLLLVTFHQCFSLISNSKLQLSEE